MILIRGGMAVGRHDPVSPEPSDVYICICNGVTQNDIRQAAVAGCRSVPELTMRTGCGASCGSCLDSAAQVLREAQQDMVRVELPLLSHAA